MPNPSKTESDKLTEKTIKDCPFCGCKAILRSISYEDSCEYIVECKNPHCLILPTTYCLEKEEAIKAWNNRKK